MKNLFKKFVIYILIICTFTIFVACDNNNGKEINSGEVVDCSVAHDFKSEWEYDKVYHYHKCKNCGEASELEKHKIVIDHGVEATVIKEGLTEGSHCSVCGYVKKEQYVIPKHVHKYNLEPDFSCLYKEATDTSNALFYEKCSCGLLGDEVFELDIKRTESNLNKYVPTSPTLTLYETTNKLVYGFTWNSVNEATIPSIKIKKSTESEYKTFVANSVKYNSYNRSSVAIEYFVYKTEIELEPNTEYKYYVVDIATGIKTKEFIFTSSNINSTKFTFASLSDSQNSDTETGTRLNKIFSNMNKNVEFYLHSGDICENTKYEENWTNMLDYNKDYLATKPLMAASGNHETLYKNGSNEIYKHFNNNIPKQPDTKKGYYYSFVYGNAKFIVLNTNNFSNEQSVWVENELKNNDKKWLIVMLHCPLYSVGKYGNSTTSQGNDSNNLRKKLSNMFSQYKVDLVIQGHDHQQTKTYPVKSYNETTKTATVTIPTTEKIDGIDYAVNPDGTIYIMNGPSGSQYRSIEYTNYPKDIYEYVANTSKCDSWAEYSIDGDTLTVVVKYCSSVDGSAKELYKWGIKKVK